MKNNNEGLAFVYNPEAFGNDAGRCDRQELLDATFRYIVRGLGGKGLKRVPLLYPYTLSKKRYGSGGKLFGEYAAVDGGKIYVSVQHSSYPTTERGRSWSWPGYKVDRTAAGILAHEFGHHIWQEHVAQYDGRRQRWRKLWQDTRKTPVSGYEPLAEEGFAETCRLFLLNPDLLERAVPERFGYFAAEIGLTPIHRQPWQTVLQFAPERLQRAAENWEAQGRKRAERVGNLLGTGY